MISRLVSPLVLPAIFLVFVWVIARRASPDRKVGHEMDRWTVIAVVATCVRYAKAWHNEIGWAWQNHPSQAALLTLLVSMALWFALKRMVEE